DQSAQRLLAGQCGSIAAREKSKAIAETRGDLLDRKRAETCGGKLQRKRNPVEPSADLGDRGSVLLRHVASPIGCNRAIDAQVFRFVLRQRGGRDRAVARGDAKRGHLEERLALDTELLSRRCE